MKNAVILLALASLSALLLIGCSCQTTYTGSGATLEKTLTYRDFTSIEISRIFVYHIAQADHYSVVASLPENLTDNLRISQSGQKLAVTLKDGAYVDAEFEVTITMPALDRLVVSGTTVGDVTGFNSGEFALKMVGTNICRLNGSARHATIQILGVSQLDASGFQTQTADVNMSGSTIATVNAVGILNAHIKGLSTLKYIGNPTMGDIRVGNLATIRQP